MTRPLSSLPAWRSSATVDPTARSLALIGIGSVAAAMVAQWRSSAGAVQDVWVATASTLTAALLADFDAELARAVVGWRLMIAGDELALAQLRTRALAAGAEPVEVQSVLVEAAMVPVYCVHCAQLLRTDPGDTVHCPHCHRRLEVRPHFSPELGGYLGVCEAPEDPGAQQ